METDASLQDFLDRHSMNFCSEWGAVLGPRTDLVTLSACVAQEAKENRLEKRWLPPLQLRQLFEFYQELHGDHESMGSWFTFHKMWTDVWCKILPVRRVGQRSRCTDCAKYHMIRVSGWAEQHAQCIATCFRGSVRSFQSVDCQLEQGVR